MTDHKRRHIEDFSNTVTVLVGSEEQSFTIHQDLICAKSKFFKAACSTRWRSGNERAVRLPDADPSIFKAYSNWIYSGGLPKDTCTSERSDDDKAAETALLVELYILGDKLDDIEMRNAIKRQLLNTMRRQSTLTDSKPIRRIYESTLPGSLMRKMMVDVTLKRQVPSNFAEIISMYPLEFVQDVAVAGLEATQCVTWDRMVEEVGKWEEKSQPE